MIEVCVGGGRGGTSMLNLLSPQEYVRGSFTYIRIVFFFYGAFSWTQNAINVSFKFSELGLAHKVVFILC